MLLTTRGSIRPFNDYHVPFKEYAKGSVLFIDPPLKNQKDNIQYSQAPEDIVVWFDVAMNNIRSNHGFGDC